MEIRHHAQKTAISDKVMNIPYAYVANQHFFLSACRLSALSCREPVVWVTPTRKEVKVNLSLNFGTFFGYTQEEGEDCNPHDSVTQQYIGTECHGVMWAADTELPHEWPVAPPIVAGKVGSQKVLSFCFVCVTCLCKVSFFFNVTWHGKETYNCAVRLAQFSSL